MSLVSNKKMGLCLFMNAPPSGGAQMTWAFMGIFYEGVTRVFQGWKP